MTTKNTGSGEMEKGGGQLTSTTGMAIEGKGKTGRLETCHPSVCVGGAVPTNCVCPTTRK